MLSEFMVDKSIFPL